MKALLQRLRLPTSDSRLSAPAFRLSGRVLYAVNHSFPFSSNGYAVRTHGVATGLARTGYDVVVATRPGVPWDQPGFHGGNVPCTHLIDGVRYVHTPVPKDRDMPLEGYVSCSASVLAELMRVFKPTAVMAASNWRNALPAAIAAHELGLPFFYEVRGFWEISQVSREPAWGQSAAFQQEVEQETAVALSAQHLFTINRFMRDELVRRSVAPERIDLVPNGFPGWAEAHRIRGVSRTDLGIKSRFVVGYIGSFNGYEGLEDLIEAAALARQRGVDVSVLLAGSSASMGFGAGTKEGCPASTLYRELAQRLGIAEFLFLPGRVAAEQAADYYAVLDLVVIPRRPFAVCEIVSPMKPVEAASQGKRVLMSDVAPLADLAPLYQSFSYFEKGNVASLADKLVELLAADSPAPAWCHALEALTWEKNVAPIVAAVRRASQSPALPFAWANRIGSQSSNRTS